MQEKLKPACLKGKRPHESEKGWDASRAQLFSWSQGIIPLENLLCFLDFFCFELLLVGIIQVPRFSGQTRSLFAGKGTDGHCNPKRKQLSFWISPFVLDACLQFSHLVLVLYLGLSDFQEQDGWMRLEALACSSEAGLWMQCYISYSVHDPTESLFWTTRRNNLFKVFWENGANGSSLVPSTTGLPKICAAFLLSTLSLPMLCLLFNKNHFKH